MFASMGTALKSQASRQAGRRDHARLNWKQVASKETQWVANGIIYAIFIIHVSKHNVTKLWLVKLAEFIWNITNLWLVKSPSGEVEVWQCVSGQLITSTVSFQENELRPQSYWLCEIYHYQQRLFPANSDTIVAGGGRWLGWLEAWQRRPNTISMGCLFMYYLCLYIYIYLYMNLGI